MSGKPKSPELDANQREAALEGKHLQSGTRAKLPDYGDARLGRRWFVSRWHVMMGHAPYVDKLAAGTLNDRDSGMNAKEEYPLIGGKQMDDLVISVAKKRINLGEKLTEKHVATLEQIMDSGDWRRALLAGAQLIKLHELNQRDEHHEDNMRLQLALHQLKERAERDREEARAVKPSMEIDEVWKALEKLDGTGDLKVESP